MNDNESPPQSPSEESRLDRVERSIATLIEQLSRLPIAPEAPAGPNIPAVPAMPAQPAEVAEIITRNKRYADVLSVTTYRLRDKSHILKPEQVATLTGLANQVRPRLEGVIFTGEPALAVLPFLAQVVKVANQTHISEAALLWIVDDFIRSPAREAFRSQEFSIWPEAVYWLLTTYVPESTLDNAVRTLQNSGQSVDESVRKFGTRLQLEAAALGSLLPSHEIKSLFAQGLRDPVKSLFAANQPAVEFESATPLSVLIMRAELLESGSRPANPLYQSPSLSKLAPFRRSSALVLPSVEVERGEEDIEEVTLLALDSRNELDRSREWTCFICFKIGHGWLDCPIIQTVPQSQKEEIVIRRRKYFDTIKNRRAGSPFRSGPPWNQSNGPRPRYSQYEDPTRSPPSSPKNEHAPSQL
jgi:hypothetical protein